jgi:beta-lactamase class A
LTYTKDRRYPGEDLLGSFANNEKLTLKKLVFLMITTSDNTASLWCQELAGTGTTINTWLKQKGFLHTRLNSRTPGRADARDRYGWGQTTPREMAQLLIRIFATASLFRPAADEEMARIMGRSYWDGEAISSVPPSVSTMSKQGAVNASRSEVVLVHAPHWRLRVLRYNEKTRKISHGNMTTRASHSLGTSQGSCGSTLSRNSPICPPAEMNNFVNPAD